MGKEIVNQVHEAQKFQAGETQRETLRHTVIKLTKTKDRDKTLKATRAKTTHNIQGNSHQAIS